MIPRYSFYLFDVDGTLLDSATDICGAVKEALAVTSADRVPESLLRTYIGRHLYDLFEDLIPGISQIRMEELLQQYRAIYHARGHRGTRLYPGVIDALSRLGGQKSTATTKSTQTTRLVLEKFGLLPYFDHVQGTDGFPSKPAPDVILRSLEALDAPPEECLLVGDSGPDMEAGRQAGVRTCAVRYGYGNREEMARWEPDYWIDDLRELNGT
ncbi:MAG TPA: HAD family hydrolase [Bryobacteraceae bacterium]|nr:HAD family hydrolase [Bryobacteraceae bacterium]